jgi:mRNA-degrading endonuclease RelE of RelBE toxin-antitoxin system
LSITFRSSLIIAIAGLIGKAKYQEGQRVSVAALNSRDRHGGNNMIYQIEFSSDAERQLSQLTSRDRNIILETIEQQLTHEPAVPTRHRKLLRENALADWQLRVGEYRVFYEVASHQDIVMILAIGVKSHNALWIEGKEIRL